MVLSGVFDSPARSAVQNFMQFNGYYGCGTGLAKGRRLQLSEHGGSTIYPFDTSNESGHERLREHAETQRLAVIAETSQKVQCGVKGVSWLLKLPFFNIIRGVGIDYMHAVLLGVTRSFLSAWVDKRNRMERWYIGAADKVRIINERLADIKPPISINRRPRPLSDLVHWKASELRSFLLFYSVPVLCGILPVEFYEHFILLAKATFILLKSSIPPSELDIAQ